MHAKGPVGEYPVYWASAEQRDARGGALAAEDGIGLSGLGIRCGHVDQHWVFRFLGDGVHGCHRCPGVRGFDSDSGFPQKMNDFVFERHGAFAAIDRDWFHRLFPQVRSSRS